MSKPIVKPVNRVTKDAYAAYAKKLLLENPTYTVKKYKDIIYEQILDADGKIVMSYKIFKTVASGFNKKAGDYIINGYSLDLMNRMGCLFIVRIERGPNAKKRLNRGESFKLRRTLKEAGTLTADNWRVYYNDEEYVKMHWYKPAFAQVPDKLIDFKFYKFTPAGGTAGNGFRLKMSREVSTNPGLKSLYPFVPWMRIGEANIKNNKVGVLPSDFNGL